MPLMFGGSADECREQRMRRERLRLELRMELASQEPRMVRRFDNFHINAIGSFAADFESSSRERRLVIAIEFVAMAMALGNLGGLIRARGKRTLLQFAGPRS